MSTLTDETLPLPTKTLFDVRGSVPVSQPQDFDAIRQYVIRTHGITEVYILTEAFQPV